MKKLTIGLLLIIYILSGCRLSREPQSGSWRAALVPESSVTGLEIPFNLMVDATNPEGIQMTIKNAGEEIRITEIRVSGDSIHLRLPVFEGTIDARLSRNRMDGSYTHRAGGRSWSVPFYADYGITDRFPDSKNKPNGNISGRWEVAVGAGSRTEKQIGEFFQDDGHLTGTFLTTTGDYRFLEGKVSGNKIMLSAFDGAHSLVFLADLSTEGNIENGIFCGGPSWKGEWRAFRNDTVTLPDPGSLTWLKPGYDKLEFSFPDTEGRIISLSDPEYAGNPVIVQIIGSWCPNCMDETRYFTGLYNEFKDQGLKIIALCFESTNAVESMRAIKRFRDNTGAGYTFLYAGESNKRKAGEALPMLNRILSYPTSVFIDRKGSVKQIFTGFSGPGTGQHYLELTNEMRSAVKAIITE